MGIELGSLKGIVGEDGAFGLLSDLLGNIGNFVDAADYFTGEDFQEAIAGGFMK
ncbi:hypothetical protein NCCP2495_13380 [Dietzia sp. NCCP-2495]|uniref:hypothetical protein n=1 Tax=Dietzia sp. NCCP-2495 TaxID=2934675 RepID=UPI002231D6B8|nr:hypothetical protein [Dietzia sp. NCCP-2495]GLB63459.1 hypothetical protein NCCP2495_13380 [Dietzia sp. NCCP-2495]